MIRIVLMIAFILIFHDVSFGIDFTTYSTGTYYGIGRKSDGSIWAWGRNNYANIGDGTYTAATLVKQIGTSTDWTKVIGTSEHTKAINSSGELYAWGKNEYGQLGDGTTTNRTTPTKIGSDTDWASLGRGIGCSIALKTNSKLYMSGLNDHGQLGTGDKTNTTSPTKIGDDTWLSVQGGAFFTIGVKAAGTLWGWGWNAAGYNQLGDDTAEDRTSPTQIGSGDTWASVICGYYHTIALKSDGTMWAWGYNGHGQIRDGTRTTPTEPTQIGNGSEHSGKTWIAIAAGYHHSLAVRSDGTLWSWGRNVEGQLGQGTTSTYNITITQVGTDSDWVEVSAGGTFSSARKTDSSIWVWGGNDYYQLANNTTTNTTTPIPLRYYRDIYVSSSGVSPYSGTKAAPYRPADIPWASYEAGYDVTTLWMFGGTYSDQFTIRHNATNNTLYIRPCSASPSPTGCDSTVIFSHGGTSPTPAYSVVLNGGANLAKYVEINGETTTGSKTHNIKIVPVFGYGLYGPYATTNITVKWVEVTGLDSGTPQCNVCTTGTSVYGMNFQDCSSCEIAYNYFHDNWGHSDLLFYANDTTPGYGVSSIHHNTFEKGTHNLITAKSNTDIYCNKFDSSETIYPYDVIHLYSSSTYKGIHYNRIFNNYFDSPHQMIFLENAGTVCGGGSDRCPTEYNLIYNNLFKTSIPHTDYDQVGHPIGFKSDTPSDVASTIDKNLITNNTFANVLYAFGFTPPSAAAMTITNFIARNNIYYEASDLSQYSGGNSIFVLGTVGDTATWANSDDMIVDNNLLYDNDTMASYHRIPGGAWVKYTSISTYNAAVNAQGTGSAPSATKTNINQNPNFAETTNYTLSASSTYAIGAGQNISTTYLPSWLTLANAPYITYDKPLVVGYLGTSTYGTLRGTAWDIGAYEYEGPAASTYRSLRIGVGGTRSINVVPSGSKTIEVQ